MFTISHLLCHMLVVIVFVCHGSVTCCNHDDSQNCLCYTSLPPTSIDFPVQGEELNHCLEFKSLAWTGTWCRLKSEIRSPKFIHLQMYWPTYAYMYIAGHSWTLAVHLLPCTWRWPAVVEVCCGEIFSERNSFCIKLYRWCNINGFIDYKILLTHFLSLWVILKV